MGEWPSTTGMSARTGWLCGILNGLLNLAKTTHGFYLSPLVTHSDNSTISKPSKFSNEQLLLDPLSFVQQVDLALFLRYAGRLDESIAVYKNAFDLNPEAAIEFRQDYLVSFSPERPV